ncbi:MAG: hypothetical protein QG622_843, partial [Actinomycetota bacterium]|nr:hypothetical protein [Actinomycetota bacterium]
MSPLRSIFTRTDRSQRRRRVSAAVALIGAGVLVGSILAPTAS